MSPLPPAPHPSRSPSLFPATRGPSICHRSEHRRLQRGRGAAHSESLSPPSSSRPLGQHAVWRSLRAITSGACHGHVAGKHVTMPGALKRARRLTRLRHDNCAAVAFERGQTIGEANSENCMSASTTAGARAFRGACSLRQLRLEPRDPETSDYRAQLDDRSANALPGAAHVPLMCRPPAAEVPPTCRPRAAQMPAISPA